MHHALLAYPLKSSAMEYDAKYLLGIGWSTGQVIYLLIYVGITDHKIDQ